MTDELSLVQAVRAHPEDDAYRLVYADWLEDNGNPRAALIRVQCELAALAASAPRRAELEARQRDLLAAHGTAWLGPFHDRECRFVRGMLEVGVPATQFPAEAAALRLSPLVWRVRATDRYLPERGWLVVVRDDCEAGGKNDPVPLDSWQHDLGEGYQDREGWPGQEALLDGPFNPACLRGDVRVLECRPVWTLIGHFVPQPGEGVPDEPLTGRHFGSCFGDAWAYDTQARALADLARLDAAVEGIRRSWRPGPDEPPGWVPPLLIGSR
jgi:uncharacterized protein (TIGR02996 family)